MKRFITICILLARVAGFAADNHHAELLCIWNYKTLYQNASANPTADAAVLTEYNFYYFFSDNTFVKVNGQLPFEEVIKLKTVTPQRWMTVNNNLILLDVHGKQESSFVGNENTPVENLLKGEKEMTQVVLMNAKTVSSTYNDVLAFFPK